jgi:hypothetical protein
MIKNKQLAIVASFIFILLAYSCKQNDGGVKSTRLNYYNLTMNISSDAKHYCTLESETQTMVEYNNNKAETNNTSEIGLICEMSTDSANQHVLKITYDKIRIVLRDKDGEQVLNTTNTNSLDPVERLLRGIIGASLSVYLDSTGDILDIKGSKEISDKILAAMAAQDEDTKRFVHEQIPKLAGESFVKNNLQQVFKLFPDSTVKVGDTWSRTLSQSQDIKFDANTTYTLSSVDDGIAEIESESEIGNIKSTNAIMGHEVSSNLTGRQTGNFKADISTGMLLRGESNTSIEGTMQVMGREVPISIKMKKQITSRKI